MAKKPATPKTPKAIEAPVEPLEANIEEMATLVLDSGENVSNALPDALELVPVVEIEQPVQEETKSDEKQEELESESVDDDVYVLNGLKQPVPAFLVSKTHVYPQEVVEDVLYAISLGGELEIEKCRLQGLPYLLTVKVPNHKKDAWESGSEKLTEDDCRLDASFSAPNWFVFLDQIVKAAKCGAIVSQQGVHFKPYIANLKLKNPMESGANVSVSTDKPKYTFKELDNMNTRQLKIVGKWYGVEKGVKIDLIPAILKLQGELPTTESN